MKRCLPLMLLLVGFQIAAQEHAVVVIEGESFKPGGDWNVIHQDQSYASHTYGGMWVSQGGLLSSEADSKDAVATTMVTVKKAGAYRVWSKYQAPAYFNYTHRIEVYQKGKKVFSHDYGKAGTDRLWSFSAQSDELFWSWGVDHDCAESPKKNVPLAAGLAQVKLISIENPQPAGARMIDFIVLTTNPADDYIGRKPYKVGSPFTNEAFAATTLYARVKHNAAKASVGMSRRGHYQPSYGGANQNFPETTKEQWSPWINIGPFIRWVHDEGLWFAARGASRIQIEFAEDAGANKRGSVTIGNGESVVIPMDLLWNKARKILPSKTHAKQLVEASKEWRRASLQKPQHILFYGAFSGSDAWVSELKDAMGYNTLLPDKYRHVEVDGYFQHLGDEEAIRGYAKKLGEKRKQFRVCSFGDEIHMGNIDYEDPQNIDAFRKWLSAKGIDEKDLGMPIAKVTLDTKNPRLAWYTRLFNSEEQFKHFRHLTTVAEEVFGPQVLTGANYSPHYPVPAYYGPIYQWIDAFKHNAMSMFWSEDYIFSMTDIPQTISWMFAQIRCAVKYNKQPIHFYAMPHASGQTVGNFRRNNLLAIGAGSRHIDHFWVAPAEYFTENYVGWHYPEQFQAIHEVIYDTAKAEPFLINATTRPASVAVLIGKATDYNETITKVDKALDPFVSLCKNAPKKITQQTCRRESILLYLGLKQAGLDVDIITEDDLRDNYHENYKVIYFAGEWINTQSIPILTQWVKRGGVFYAAAGVGHRNQFNEAAESMLAFLGLKSASLTKDNYVLRMMSELVLSTPIGRIGDSRAIGFKQEFEVADAKVLQKWSTGRAAVTERTLGEGRIYAVGTLPGHSYMKTGLKVMPYGRGGHRQPYNPIHFGGPESELMKLALTDLKSRAAAISSVPYVETLVLDNDKGSCVTLINWNNQPIKETTITVQSEFKPSTVHSVEEQKDIPFDYKDGKVTFKAPLIFANYFLLSRK